VHLCGAVRNGRQFSECLDPLPNGALHFVSSSRALTDSAPTAAGGLYCRQGKGFSATFIERAVCGQPRVRMYPIRRWKTRRTYIARRCAIRQRTLRSGGPSVGLRSAGCFVPLRLLQRRCLSYTRARGARIGRASSNVAKIGAGKFSGDTGAGRGTALPDLRRPLRILISGN